MANSNLHDARKAKNDEFYTQYHDVEKEVSAYLDYNPNVFRGKTVLLPCDNPMSSNFTKYFAQNFSRLGLKKLISTSFAPASKNFENANRASVFEQNNKQHDEHKSMTNGKIFTLAYDKTGDGKIDINDLHWEYLEGDGDFRSDEIKQLRDEADVIITNPPFSLFREFLAWLTEANKQFAIIGNRNAITYKEVFPLIKENNMWLGYKQHSGNSMYFTIADKEYAKQISTEKAEGGWWRYINNEVHIAVNSVWFTNIDHGRRHQPLQLMTMADNLKFSKHKEIKGSNGYQKYDNYDAIEVPYTDAIPSDYDGVMGVPISFLDKYCPEQFEIVGGTANGQVPQEYKLGHYKTYNNPILGGVKLYQRILIQHRKEV